MKFALPDLSSGITKEERADPQVQVELGRRIRAMFVAAMVGNMPTAIFMAFLLWSRTDRVPLVIWVVLTSLAGPLYALNMRDGENWTRRAWVGQIWAGVAWGLLPVMAMPAEEAWQLVVTCLLVGVMAANVIFGSAIRSLFYQFHVALAGTALVGYALHATGAGLVGGGSLIAYSSAFSVVLAELTHRTSLEAAVFSVRNSKLAAGLAEEQTLLEAANRRLDQRSRTDPLTGLSNRLDLTQRLDQALADNSAGGETTVGLVYVDLDGFKSVNDSFGHRVGDLLLIKVTERLKRVLNDGEVLARQGGDELVVMSPRLHRIDGPSDLAHRLGSVFNDPVEVEGTTIPVSATFGIATADADTTADNLLRQADAALYQGKAGGRGVAVVFDRAMQEELAQHKQHSAELDAALQSGRLLPHLQPVVDLATGAIVAAEALVRWEHPEGVRTAASFIDLAARRGLVPHINRIVIGGVIDYLAASTGGTRNPPPRIAVNVAANHLEGLLEDLADVPSLRGIEIEITEHATFGPIEEAQRMVAEAHRRGATVMLDDFGTGFSSLSMAMHLDVDGYKIDRMFVDAMLEDDSAHAVAAAIVELANRRGRYVVAEGVETVEQARALASMGVTLAQGYLFSPAVPIPRFDDWIVAGHRFEGTITPADPA